MKKGIALRTVKKTAEELLNTIKVAIYIRVNHSLSVIAFCPLRF